MASHAANSITDEFMKVLALREIAEVLAATDPDCAARLFTDAERAANCITSELSKARILSSITHVPAATSRS